MTEALLHRGPDAIGGWSDGRCSLGHCRLAVVDLSDTANQPISNEDNSIWITYNGEIYNHRSLRHMLEGVGHRFRTSSDTEAIVHAYEQWGTGCVSRLRGMFAFAIWDQKRQVLFLARDRVGKKPLYLSWSNGRLLFASEIQGLLADPEVGREVDLRAIDAFMTWSYVPAPRTGFAEIEKLEPAEWMTVDVSRGHAIVRRERYWRLEYSPKHSMTPSDAISETREVLEEAVRLRLVADVPVGAFLSGGIDSSIVVGLMAKLSASPVRTFSIDFGDPSYSEILHARRIAELWGTEHHEFEVRPEAIDILPRLVKHYGEPYADSSAIPSYYVSKVARSGVKVALNGDGGDESFGGYPRYRNIVWAQAAHSVPGVRQAAGALAAGLGGLSTRSELSRRGRGLLLSVARDTAFRHAWCLSIFRPEDKARLYRPAVDVSLEGAAWEWMMSLHDQYGSEATLDAVIGVEVHGRLAYDLLTKMDIASMANSLEARSPFLDHEVMEWAARLPTELKVRRWEGKYLLTRAFADLLPPENVLRRKMGFSIPLAGWLRGSLRELLCDSLLSEDARTTAWFDRREVKRLVTEHLGGRGRHALQLWTLLTLELWCREVVEGSALRARRAGASLYDGS